MWTGNGSTGKKNYSVFVSFLFMAVLQRSLLDGENRWMGEWIERLEIGTVLSTMRGVYFLLMASMWCQAIGSSSAELRCGHLYYRYTSTRLSGSFTLSQDLTRLGCLVGAVQKRSSYGTLNMFHAGG